MKTEYDESLDEYLAHAFMEGVRVGHESAVGFLREDGRYEDLAKALEDALAEAHRQARPLLLTKST